MYNKNYSVTRLSTCAQPKTCKSTAGLLPCSHEASIRMLPYRLFPGAFVSLVRIACSWFQQLAEVCKYQGKQVASNTIFTDLMKPTGLMQPDDKLAPSR